MAVVELQNLSLRIQDKTIVDDLNLTIPSGQMFALLGPSGGGKTTTLRLLGGFLHPTAGVIRIDGEDVTFFAPERRPTSMMFQQYALWPHMTVWQNVTYGLTLRKMPKEIVDDQAHSMLAMVGLSGVERSYPAQLSGGQQQRVALARSLVLKPKVLLLDEPLSNLDAKLRVRVREEIREIQQRVGITTVLVTHDQDEALSIADRVAILADGKILQVDTPQNLYGQPHTKFVANFVGTMNWYQGRVDKNIATIQGISIPIDNGKDTSHEQAEIGVRPEDVRLNVDASDPQATVVRRVSRGHYQEWVISTEFGQIQVFGENRLHLDDQVRYRFAQCHTFAVTDEVRDGTEPRSPSKTIGADNAVG